MNKRIKKIFKQVISLTVTGSIMAGGTGVLSVEAATQEQKDAFKKEFVEMVLSGDGTVHDVRHYNMKFTECNDIAADVEANEGKYAYKCYYNQMIQATMDGKYVDTVWLYASDEGFAERYKRFMEKLSEAKSLISPEMTDMEKLVCLHDYLVKNTYYKDDGTFCHREAGPLGLGYGVCDGYTRTLQLLLEEYGIESETVSNTGHMWLAVKLDGEMYHVDPTWADTRTTQEGEVSHYFLVRNDNEYMNSEYSPHSGWSGTVSVSDKYTDWYVHDIVGEMLYEDGYWYYEKNGAIVRNDINGEAYQLMIAGDNLELESVKDSIVTYSENGKYYESSIKEINNKVESEEVVTPTETPTATPTEAPTVTPTEAPTVTPTEVPTATPTEAPTATPTEAPTTTPTEAPTVTPTETVTTTPEVPAGTTEYQELKGIVVSQSVLESCFKEDECFEKGYRIEYKFGVVFEHDKTKIYYVKIWDENGNLLREYIPVLDAQGYVCIYETVTDTCQYYFGEILAWDTLEE